MNVRAPARALRFGLLFAGTQGGAQPVLVDFSDAHEVDDALFRLPEVRRPLFMSGTI